MSVHGEATDLSSAGEEFRKAVEISEKIRKVDIERYGKRAKISRSYYFGEQFSDSYRKKYWDKYSQYPLVDNSIQPKIDAIYGAHLQNRTDTKVITRTNGSEDRDARIFQALLKDVDKKSKERIVTAAEFFDLLVTGRAASEIKLDHDVNPNGQLIYEHQEWDQVHPDPDDNTKHYTKMNDCIKEMWLSATDLLFEFDGQLTASAKAKLQRIAKNEQREWREEEENEFYGNNQDWLYYDEIEKEGQRFKKNHLFLVLKRYFLKKTTGKFKFDSENNTFEVEPGETADFEREKSEVWVQIMAKAAISEFLMNEKHVLQPQFNQRTVLPMVICRDQVYEKKTVSKVWQVKEKQDIKNQLRSTELEYLAKGPKGQWVIEQGSWVGTLDNLKDMISRPGQPIIMKKNGKKPEFEQGVPLPPGYEQMDEKMERSIVEQMGVTPEFQGGSGGASESGKLRQLKLFQTFTRHKPLFDTYIDYQNMRSEIIMSLIPQSYTLTETLLLTSDTSGDEDGEEITLNSVTWDGHIENDITTLNFIDYKAEVIQVEESPTFMQSQHEDIQEMIDKSQDPVLKAILMRAWVKTSQLPDKEKIADELDQVLRQQIGLQQREAEIKEGEAQATIEGSQLGNQAIQIQNDQEQLNNELGRLAIEGNLPQAVGAPIGNAA